MAKGKEVATGAEDTGALAIYEQFNLVETAAELRDVMDVNLGGESIGESDLDRIKVPAAGGRLWAVPDADGVEQDIPVITGIILHTCMTRAYWPEKYSGGATPPQCYSNDGVNGNGEPGGQCSICPFNEWASDPHNPESRAKACQEKRSLFILQPGNLLPMFIRAPAGSLRKLKKFLLDLSTKRRKRTWEVVTELYLTKEKNAQGIDFSMINCKVVEILPTDVAANVAEFRKQLLPIMDRASMEATVAQDDYTESDKPAETEH
jgi:hypothetical protein